MRTTPEPSPTAIVRELAGPSTPALLARAALPAVPVLRRLPGVRHTGRQLPDLVLTRRGVGIERAHLSRYAAVCGFALTDVLPATYPHVLAFGLQLALLTDPEFPFAPLGLVHLDNTITVHRPIAADEVLDLAVHPTALRPHRKGRLVDLVSTAHVGDELVWEETTTLLARGGGDASGTTGNSLRGLEAPTGPVTWRLPGDLGRRYAAVSGDYNPIHVSGLSAKALGFSRAIAHGMWTKARCLAALQGRLPDAYAVQVAFGKPILLPGTVTFGTGRDADASTRIGVTSPSGNHLVGRVTPSG